MATAFHRACLLLAALVHVLPIAGLVRRRLPALYGIAPPDDGTALLLRHRAISFGLLAALLAAGAFVPSLDRVARAAGVTSAASFVVLAWPWGRLSPSLRRVVVADLVAIVALALASIVGDGASGPPELP